MTAKLGRDLIVQFDKGSTTFVAIAGQRSTRFSIGNEIVDITTKDNETAAGGLQRILLEQAGLSSMSVNLSGIFTDTADEETFRTKVINNTLVSAKIIIPGTAGGAGGIIAGNFQVSNFENAGEHNGEVNYSMTLESAGEYTYTSTV